MLLTARASRTFLGVSLLSAKSSFAWTLPTAKTGVCKILRRASSSPNDSAVDFGNEFKDMAPSSPPSLTVVQMPCLTNNYGYLIHDDSTGYTAAIDVPEAKRYQEELGKRNWKLTHIFNTHHHFDHTGGNMELKGDGVVVYGPHSEQIPGRDVALKGGDEIEFGTIKGQVMDVGGHTKGHIAYYFPSEDKVFVGDALFALGCGRMFEGTPDQFWTSLKRLRDLPDETEVFCAHEYTLDNARFAESVEPGNEALMGRVKRVEDLRKRGHPTVPSLLGDEKKTNPFLRCDKSAEIRMNVGATVDDSDAVVFGKVRRAKDLF